MQTPIRILIADDHPVVRFGLTKFLNDESDISVVGEAGTAVETVHKMNTLRPDITLLDLEMGELHGVEALQHVREAAPAARVIIYTAFCDEKRILDAVELGVQGYLLKDGDTKALAMAIRNIHTGGTSLAPEITTKLLQHMQGQSKPMLMASSAEALTNREHQVLHELVEGKSNRAIARHLYITERTVKFHVSSILNKLHAKNRTEAVLIAAQSGIVNSHHATM